jgi:hypothetical protein
MQAGQFVGRVERSETRHVSSVIFFRVIMNENRRVSRNPLYPTYTALLYPTYRLGESNFINMNYSSSQIDYSDILINLIIFWNRAISTTILHAKLDRWGILWNFNVGAEKFRV